MTRSVGAKQLLVTGLAALLACISTPQARAALHPGDGDSARLEARLDALEHRVTLLQDENAIEKLTRAYGYYVDKQLWDQVAALFTDDCRIEISGRGVYLGKRGAERFFQGSLGGGRIGLKPGTLFNHMILQGIVDVSPDGRTAKGRWRALMQLAVYHGFALWGEGTYENDYRKQNGVWKISGMHFYSTYYTPYGAGPAEVALPNNGPSKAAPPDLPPSVDYDVFPGHYVPPFHYANPVSGRPWTLEDTEKYSTHGDNPPPLKPPPSPSRSGQSGH